MAKAKKNEGEKCPNCGASRLIGGICEACGIKGKPAAKKATNEKATPGKNAPAEKNKSNNT